MAMKFEDFKDNVLRSLTSNLLKHSSMFTVTMGSMFQTEQDESLVNITVNPITVLGYYERAKTRDLYIKDEFIPLRNEIYEYINNKYAVDRLVHEGDEFVMEFDVKGKIKKYYFPTQKDFITFVVNVCILELEKGMIEGYFDNNFYTLDILYSKDAIIDLILFLRHYEDYTRYEYQNTHNLNPFRYTRVKQNELYNVRWIGITEEEWLM